MYASGPWASFMIHFYKQQAISSEHALCLQHLAYIVLVFGYHFYIYIYI